MENKQTKIYSNVLIKSRRRIWIYLLLLNIVIYLIYFGIFFYNDVNHNYTFIQHLIESATDGTMVFIIIVSIIATWFSGINLKWRNQIGFGIPILFLLLALIIKLITSACQGFFCIQDLVILVFGSFSIIFILFFSIGIYLRKF